MKFVVGIEETVTDTFEVEAEDIEQALETAEEKYTSGEFVLEPGDVIHREMAIVGPSEHTTEWKEF